MSSSQGKNLLVLGCKGGLAQILCHRLSRDPSVASVIGVDSRRTNHLSPPPKVEYRTSPYNRGTFENLFRNNRFDTVVHLARVSHSLNKYDLLSKKLDLSLLNTERILDLALNHGVKRMVLLSTYHVYGALPDNPIFLDEDSPLRASQQYPELRDVVNMDQICTRWMWRHQNKVATVVLRPCNIIGPHINNVIAKYLAGPVLLKPIDFYPRFQFIHEYDMAHVLHLAASSLAGGIYNVGRRDTVDLEEIYESLDGRIVPFPMFTAHFFNQFLKLTPLRIPSYLLDYLKFSCLVDSDRLQNQLPKNFWRFSTQQATASVKARSL